MINTTKPTLLLSGAYKSGIGSSIRNIFQKSGWHVIALYDDNDQVQLSSRDEDNLSTKIAVNLKNPKSIQTMIEKLPEHIDAFVHADIFFDMDASFHQEIWSNTLQVNVISAAQIVEGIKNRLKKAGSIVAISSTEAFTGSFGSAAYASSRAAIHNLIKSWANKFGVEGIRANAVAAGWIGGVMDTDEVFNKSKKITPLGRLGLPDEVANTVKFLCSRDASFINGSVITVDGGYSGVDNVSKYEYQEHLASSDFLRFTSEFITGRAGANDEIWALSIMFEGEWIGQEADKFRSDQLSAAKRGAHINRVIIVPPDLETKFDNNHPLVEFHYKHKNISGYKIHYNNLKKNNPELLNIIKDGWTALNDELLILDNQDPIKTRGTLITSGSKIAHLRKTFEQLMKIAEKL